MSPTRPRIVLAWALVLLEGADPGFRAAAARFGNEETIGGLRFGRGFVTAPDGSLYSWHFWLYPMLVAPFGVLVQALGMAPATAFTLFNGLCAALALAYLLLRWRAPPGARALLASLFLLSGTTYYLWWSHPEVYTASLLLLALMLASDRRHGVAMLACALAAAQNPPLVLLMGGIGALGLWTWWRGREAVRRQDEARNARWSRCHRRR